MMVTYRWDFGVDILFVDVDAIPFCLLVFLLTVRTLSSRSVGVCRRSTPDPVCLGISSGGSVGNAEITHLLHRSCWELQTGALPIRPSPIVLKWKHMVGLVVESQINSFF